MFYCECGKCKNRIEVTLEVLRSNERTVLDKNLIQVLINAPARSEVLAVMLSNEEAVKLIERLQFFVNHNKENPLN